MAVADLAPELFRPYFQLLRLASMEALHLLFTQRLTYILRLRVARVAELDPLIKILPVEPQGRESFMEVPEEGLPRRLGRLETVQVPCPLLPVVVVPVASWAPTALLCTTPMTVATVGTARPTLA